MRLTTVILLASLMQLNAASFGQKLTYSKRGSTLAEVFQAIETQTGYSIFFSNQQIDKRKKIDVSFKDTELKEALDVLAAKSAFEYAIDEKNISIKPKEPSIASVILNSFQNLLKDLTVRGVVKDQDGKPLPNASIRVKGKNTVINTNQNGEFEIKDVPDDAVLLVSYVGYKALEIPVKGAVMPLQIKLDLTTGELQEVAINYSTGYQTLPKERSTGSFAYISNKNFNEQTGTNILDRLKGIASGVLFDDTKDKAGNKLNFSVRGLSTINGPRDPLIVIDNFIYEGDINNINPNDIESVTVLKDAAATSIYGARGGNGVVVFSTKKGKFNQATSIDFNANVMVTEKPDLYYLPQILSQEYVEMEQFLFNKGFYNSTINSTSPTALISPAVDIFNQLKKGLIPKADSARLINELAATDSREQYNKYFYRTGITQQYTLNLRGGSDKLAWVVSGGLDRNIGTLDAINNKFNLRFDHVYRPVKNLQISLGGYYTSNISKSGKGLPVTIGSKQVPYLKFVDDSGNPLPIARYYRQSYINGAGGGKLLDWNYYPLEDYKNNYTNTDRNELLVNFGLNYKVTKDLDFDLKYQHQQQRSEATNYRNKESFYTRDLINKFSQIDPVTGTVKYIVPVGDINTLTNSKTSSQSFRGQFNFDKTWSAHSVSAFLGTEIREIINRGDSYTIYGYKKDPLTQVTVDYLDRYPLIYGGTSLIPGVAALAPTHNNRFLSFYANSAYTYKNRYTVSASARKDGANVLGAKTNDKFKPLWSAGLSWLISSEEFYSFKTIPYLKIRSTYGYSGNVDLNRTALPIAQYGTNTTSNLPFGYINQLNNPELKWEQVSTFNLGLDFGFKNSIVSGSLDYYIKHGSDLYGQTPYDYTAFGKSQFVTRNVADMKGTGLDLMLNSQNINAKSFSWNTGLLFNYNTSKTTRYYTDESLKIGNLIGTGNAITPIVGKPLYAIAAYKWAGLDAKGNPQSYVNGQKSIDYAAIFEEGMSKGLDGNVVYVGTASPAFFGSLSNTIKWKDLDLSFSLLYKMGYYFVKPALSYTQLSSVGSGTAEYTNRWQKPGDELYTNVPSFLYPIDSSRDGIYASSEINALKGDHVRLQYVNLAYHLNNSILKSFWIKDLRLYINVADLGILWKANKYGLDPDYPATLKPSRRLTFGLNANF